MTSNATDLNDQTTPTGAVWADHNTEDETWCPYSGQNAPADAVGDGDARCPQGCPDSSAEELPYPAPIELGIDNQDDRLCEDPRAKKTYTAKDKANRANASQLAQLVAEMVREMLPTAETIIFRGEASDGDPKIDLFLIRDAAGALLWFSDYADDHPQAVAYIAERRPRKVIDPDVVRMIETALAEAYESDNGPFYTASSDDAEHFEHINALTLPVSEALAWQAPATNVIDFDRLAYLLSSETGKLDPEDVPDLMEAIRKVAAAPNVWKFPKHTNKHGSWCRWSGVEISPPNGGTWATDGNLSCPHECPNSDATPVMP